MQVREAPSWECSDWLNSNEPITQERLRGRVIVAAAFQMLCPGCVAQTIPQLIKVRELFSPDQVAVIGLHTVFEHHAGMGIESLRAFLHEYRVTFPVGIDRHEPGQPVPITMQRYRFQGTPSLILIDQQGMLRRQTFGHIPDLQLGAEIMGLLKEAEQLRTFDTDAGPGGVCEVGSGRC